MSTRSSGPYADTHALPPDMVAHITQRSLQEDYPWKFEPRLRAYTHSWMSQYCTPMQRAWIASFWMFEGRSHRRLSMRAFNPDPLGISAFLDWLEQEENPLRRRPSRQTFLEGDVALDEIMLFLRNMIGREESPYRERVVAAIRRLWHLVLQLPLAETSEWDSEQIYLTTNVHGEIGDLIQLMVRAKLVSELQVVFRKPVPNQAGDDLVLPIPGPSWTLWSLVPRPQIQTRSEVIQRAILSLVRAEQLGVDLEDLQARDDYIGSWVREQLIHWGHEASLDSIAVGLTDGTWAAEPLESWEQRYVAVARFRSEWLFQWVQQTWERYPAHRDRLLQMVFQTTPQLGDRENAIRIWLGERGALPFGQRGELS